MILVRLVYLEENLGYPLAGIGAGHPDIWAWDVLILSWVKTQYYFKLKAAEANIYLPDGEPVDDGELLRTTDNFCPQFLSKTVFIRTESNGGVNSIS